MFSLDNTPAPRDKLGEQLLKQDGGTEETLRYAGFARSGWPEITFPR